jgi:glycosyltransferase involved in cell wall biosynthesis
MIDRGNATPAGGIGEYATSLSAALATHQSGVLEVADSGASSSPVRFRPASRLVYLYRLRKLRMDGYGGARVVHFTNIFVPPVRRGVAYVGTVHDLDPLLLPAAHTRRYRYYFEYAAKMTMNRSDLLVTQSEAVREELVERFGVAPERVVVGANGLNPAFMAAADREPKSNPEVPSMLFIGQVNRKKNVRWLVRTFSEGVRRGALPAMRLVLVGRPGFGSAEVERELRSAGPNVTWERGCPLEALVKLLCSSTMLVLPSQREGFGRPLLEAMYCGKPVVASRIPSSCEVAGDAGRYFALGSEDEFYAAVKDVLSRKDEEARLRSARARLANYAWDRLAAVYRDIYFSAATVR